MDEQMQLQIVLLVQAAMQGDQQAQQQVLQIMQAAQQGDPQAQLIAQMIQAIVQQMQGQQALMARFGAKLNYIKFLRGKCPEGYEMQYFKNGGKAGCKKCLKAQKAEEGDVIDQFRCGRKMKKKAEGGNVDSAKCGKKMKKAQGGLKTKKVKDTGWTNTDEGKEREKTYPDGTTSYIHSTPNGNYAKGRDGKWYNTEEKVDSVRKADDMGPFPYLKKRTSKKANGGTIDIFAPYRNLKLK